MKLSDLILGASEQGSFGQRFTFALCIMIVVVIGLFLIIMFFPIKDDKKIGSRIIVSIVGAALVFGAPTIVGYLLPKPAELPTQQNSALIKKWAENNYLVSMSTTEAKILDEGKIDYDKTPWDIRNSSEVVGTYYDEKIVVTLLKVDSHWKLFNNGKELPLAEANKK